MNPVAYEGMMSEPVDGFRRELKIQFRSSDSRYQKLSPDLQVVFSCCSLFSHILLGYLNYLDISKVPQNFRKKDK